jgi:DNA/RNA endonuclease YhcR with UshA esterase domain
MQEKTLLKISLVTSLVGILVLLIILDKIDVSDSNINAINKTLNERQVKVKGEVTRITETPGLYILNIKDNTGNIDVIIFKEEKLDLEKGNIIQVQGQVTEYQGKMEIIAKKVIIL